MASILTPTLPETNIARENPIFPGKYHQNGGFSMAMLVYRSVIFLGQDGLTIPKQIVFFVAPVQVES